MAQARTFQKLSYPLPVYNYRVSVDGKAMSFSEVSGIVVEYDAATYRHGLSFWEGEKITSFYYDSFLSVTMKRGTILGREPLFLYDWLEKKDLRTLDVSLCDEAGEPLISWRIDKALPIKLEAPSFTADANDVAIESLELKVRRISLIRH